MNDTKARMTAHTYDAPIAERVFSHIPGFLQDVRDLLARLENAVA